MISLSEYGVNVDTDNIVPACQYCAPVLMGYGDDLDPGTAPALNVPGLLAHVGSFDIDDIEENVGSSCENCEGEFSPYGVGYTCEVFVEN